MASAHKFLKILGVITSDLEKVFPHDLHLKTWPHVDTVFYVQRVLPNRLSQRTLRRADPPPLSHVTMQNPPLWGPVARPNPASCLFCSKVTFVEL